LSIESFGIHGTPEPEKVGKAYSQGCVRLTNWDVEELSKMVEKGTPVEFIE
jgi:lipoprotein-anchoring transpeptidase ErfK/SrfK